MREDRKEWYALIDKYGVKGHQRYMAIKLFEHIRSATRRMRTPILYKYIMITIHERQYLIINSNLVNDFINHLVPHFASMRGRFKKKIQYSISLQDHREKDQGASKEISRQELLSKEKYNQSRHSWRSTKQGIGV